MPGTNKLRVATIDTTRVRYIACSEVVAATGLPVLAEFQEIEGNNVIIELQIGDETIPHSSAFPTRSRGPDKAVADLEVLSSWKEPALLEPTPRHCPEVIGVGDLPLPQVAQRAYDDDLPTAKWDHADSSWHLAVPIRPPWRSRCRNVTSVRI